MMTISYSGPQVVKKEQSVVVNDPARGSIRFVSNIIHRFKIAAVRNCGSRISFLKVNENTYVSINTFIIDFVGRYVIKMNDQDLFIHTPIKVQVDFEPVTRCKNPDNLEEIRYESQT